MATSVIKRLENGNIEITLSVPWADIEAGYQTALDQAVANYEMDGFRKGHAPKELVEPKLDKNSLYTNSLQQLLPAIYSQAITDQKIKPLVNPHIHLDKAETGQDWQVTFTTCEVPLVALPADYLEQVKQVKPKTPESKLSDVVAFLKSIVTFVVPDLIVEEEANHRLSALVDNVTQLGFTIESYLQSKKLTSEELKAQVANQSRYDLEVEFILIEVQKLQNLTDRKSTLDFLASQV